MAVDFKICSNCKEEKILTLFGKDKYAKDSLTHQCKICRLANNKRYALNNPEKLNETNKAGRVKRYLRDKEIIKQQTKEYYQANKGKCIAYQKDYNITNREIVSKKSKHYYGVNKARIAAQKGEVYKENSEAIKMKVRQYELTNKEKVSLSKRLYAEKHKVHLRKKKREYEKNRYQTDIVFRLNRNLRRRVSLFFSKKGWIKNNSTHTLLGAPALVIKNHIEERFTTGMTWDNYGAWHIDHIIPISSAKTIADAAHLCHYMNLQPLWAKDNREKSNKIYPINHFNTQRYAS